MFAHASIGCVERSSFTYPIVFTINSSAQLGSEMAQVWLNGNFIDESTATISIRDTGLLHAAGVLYNPAQYAAGAPSACRSTCRGCANPAKRCLSPCNSATKP